MSSPSSSQLPEDPLEPVLDLREDPPVDQGLREMMQRLSVGPTVEEQSRFWTDLSEKLPEQKAPAKTFARPGLKRYLPWTALASGFIVVLLMLVKPGEEMSKQAALSDFVAQEAPVMETEPMVLGAPPPAARSTAVQKKEKQELASDNDISVPFGLSSPGFEVRWEQRSDRVFWAHIAPEHESRLLDFAKQWPAGIDLSKLETDNAPPHGKGLVYRLEDRR